MFVTAILLAETKFGFRALFDDVKDVLAVKSFSYATLGNVAANFVSGVKNDHMQLLINSLNFFTQARLHNGHPHSSFVSHKKHQCTMTRARLASTLAQSQY